MGAATDGSRDCVGHFPECVFIITRPRGPVKRFFNRNFNEFPWR